ncbi:MAG: cation-translocating P-type ATPase [Gammaproteobacteria bacterium]
MPGDDVCAAHGASPSDGLGRDVANERLAQCGENRIADAGGRGIGRLIVTQFSDFMIIVLICAAIVSGLIGDLKDTIAIMVIVLLNAAIGIVQGYRAERAVEALRKLATPSARIRRGGSITEMPSTAVVPGDIVMVEAGDIVAADLRLLESAHLEIDESMLTGESSVAAKTVAPLDDAELVVADRTNMAYRGTEITNGHGIGVVVATAMATEMGRIAGLLHASDALATPLQKRLTQFGKRLALIVLFISAAIFGLGILRGEPAMLMLLTAVSLAVAAIPEALPAVVSISLALGAYRMAQHHALVRNLPAVETLGSVAYICADKTGTLTENEMRVESAFIDGERIVDLSKIEWSAPAWSQLGRALALANDVAIDERSEPIGDPTERALLELAEQNGHSKRALEAAYPRIGEVPFDATRKRMSTMHHIDGQTTVFTKGAPETVIPLCINVLETQGVRPLDVDALLSEADALAAQGYRVLAIATTDVDPGCMAEEAERDLTLLALVGLLDPPRAEVPDSIRTCISAGITPVMITGDHVKTAQSIASRIGIEHTDEQVLTGDRLTDLADAELDDLVLNTRVYARVTPEQKLRIVEALQRHGQFVAMTGDGVNDAPAVNRADIGIAMGRKGTEVARHAADLVLLDDNFASIVRAVRDGRRIYDNIRKFVKYTMTSNAGEIWTLLLAPLFGLPLPLLPIQILWINLVTDGLPGLALSIEPEERGIMQRPPRPPGETIFAHGVWQHMLWVGLLIGALSIGAQAGAYFSGSENWQTMVFTVLTFCQLAHVLVIRSDRESLLSLGLFGNRPLLGAVALTVILQLTIVYVPALQPVFRTGALSPVELVICFALPIVILVAVEVEKWLARTGKICRSGL